jgi:hypothetical protein
MKKVILLALLMPFPAFGQIIDNFETGSITNWVQSTDGHWKADTSSAISGNYSLHHIFDNPDAGSDRIGIQVKNLHPSEGTTRWTFLLRHGYDPSSSNNWAVFLMSDMAPASMSLDGGTNGFAIGVNLTGTDDTLRLMKVKGNTLACVVNCRINWQSTVGISRAAKISVDRSAEGNFTVSVHTLAGILLGISYGSDNELFSHDWFGVLYRYSSSRDRLLWMDNITINGTFYEDNEPPVITGCKATGKNSVELVFNEAPNDSDMVTGNFILNTGDNLPVSVSKKNSLTYIIKFSKELINKSINKLIVKKICDNSENCAINSEITFTPLWVETGDVVITEVMADPFPVVSFPSREYLEVTNRTGYSFNMKKWELKSDDQICTFGETVIKPGEIMILCSSEDLSLFSKYGSVTGLKQFPTLTDGGRIIYLTDSTGSLIHGVEYSSGWYHNELKSGGGWSLEMIDINYPFEAENNWTASESRNGGTPGTVNSVSANNPDNMFFGIVNVIPDDNMNIRIRFSEPLSDLPGLMKSITINGNGITYLGPVDPLFREFVIKLSEPLSKGEIYDLEVSGDVTDFAGNLIRKKSYSFGIPEIADPGDILFNELLFNPLPGDPDYIELYNFSGKIIDASRLQIISVNESGSDTSQTYTVSDEKKCFMPGSYYAITTDRRKILERYFSSDTDYVFETGNLPTMADDKGHLILYNRELDKLDEVRYNEKMHFSLLSGTEGVSLEKADPDLDSDNAANWHSASESSGWGTPGAPNSVFSEIPAVTDKLEFSSTRITPDNDGNEDFLVMHFSLTGTENIISVLVFDETGNRVKKIATNLLSGPETSLIWDGSADDGTLVRTGVYIVFATIFDETGKAEKWKKVCAVIRR